ncbi:MAG: DnaJ domain-containing protein [Bryobacteraceae bacterium]
MEPTAKRQRRRGPRKPADSSVIHVEMKDGLGNSRYVMANLVDLIGGGCGLALMTPLKPGSIVVLRGKFGQNRALNYLRAGVKWCNAETDGTFRAGLEFLDHCSTFILDEEPTDRTNQALDCYEVMQLSPHADAETISRVFRLLAFRYHPDNAETGNSEMFLRLSEAHQILSDPQKRASYDAAHRGPKRLGVKTFGEASTTARGDREKPTNFEVVTAAYLEVMPLQSTVCWEG